jgi:hypothetical protein
MDPQAYDADISALIYSAIVLLAIVVSWAALLPREPPDRGQDYGCTNKRSGIGVSVSSALSGGETQGRQLHRFRDDRQAQR